MITTKIIPLNQNSNKVLELLNEDKYNLCHLVMQYDNIIELYLQLLGGKDWEKPNSNEVILPEIINLLETLNYNCEFTKSGIHQDGKAIFTLSGDEISIINGKNSTHLSRAIINMQNGNQLYIINLKIYLAFLKKKKRIIFNWNTVVQIPLPYNL